MDGKQVAPWFADSEGAILLYKINRRPKPNLFSEAQPTDVLAHVDEVLSFGEPVTTGRKYRRTWLLGNRAIDQQNQQLSGQIGWERHDTEPADAYDEDAREWIDAIQPKDLSARSVFVFDASTRLLAVVKHPSFSESTVANVFRELLLQGENERKTPTTDWDVEPVLDEEGFREWLDQTQAVERVRFVAKLPNPGGLDEFPEVWERLERLKAGKIEENIEARNPDEGLENITTDPDSAEFIAMARHGYGYITATGSTSTGITRKYDQRDHVRKEYRMLPDSWHRLVVLVKDVLNALRGRE